MLVVAAVAVQKATPGELGDLFADQALFVIAVAQAFVGGGHQVTQGLELPVGAGEVTAGGEAWVGRDETGSVRMYGEQAVVGQGEGPRGGRGGYRGRCCHGDGGVVFDDVGRKGVHQGIQRLRWGVQGLRGIARWQVGVREG